MSGRNIYDRYTPGLVPENHGNKPVGLFVFKSKELLVNITGGTLSIPVKITMDELQLKPQAKYYLGKLDGCDCYCIATDDSAVMPEGTAFRKFRSLLGRIDEVDFMLAGRAYHLLEWLQKNRFCGVCGSETEMKQDERARTCGQCGHIIYPRISPAVIVAITRGSEILLAHASNFKENMYSLIAGFVEPGETFEDCIRREVFEEVGIKVKNLKYFGSQPWPFPDSLMVGFTAEYESGEISVDGQEITSAGWFTGRNLPEIPTVSSIAGQIIKWFCEN